MGRYHCLPLRASLSIAAALSVLTALSLAPSPAAGQEPRGLRDDVVPRELAEALLAITSGWTVPGTARAGTGRGAPPADLIVVGALPPGMRGRVFVAGDARVLGGMATPEGTIALVSTTVSPDSVRSVYLREQARLGWTPVSPPSMIPTGAWGFINPAAGMPPQLSGVLTLCSASQLLTVTPLEQGSSTLVQMRLGPGGSFCSGGAGVARGAVPGASPTPFSTMPLRPALINPPAAASMAMSACPVEASGGAVGNARLGTLMTPAELLDHYGRQLVDSGWTVAAALQMAGRTWFKTDSLGRRHELELVTRMQEGFPTCQRVEMFTRTMR